MTAAHSAAHGVLGGFLLLTVLFAIVMYFVPLIVAIIRKKSNVVAIGALNVLLGWSLIGWVVAFVWALSKYQVPVIIETRSVPEMSEWR
jgi:hypothetical protein